VYMMRAEDHTDLLRSLVRADISSPCDCGVELRLHQEKAIEEAAADIEFRCRAKPRYTQRVVKDISL